MLNRPIPSPIPNPSVDLTRFSATSIACANSSAETRPSPFPMKGACALSANSTTIVVANEVSGVA